MKAYSLIRTQPHYRHDAFLSGLRAAGFEVVDAAPSGTVSPGDVLCIWNRYGRSEEIADRFEEQGGIVLVAENGYVQGRHDGGDYYALAVHGHNGAGRWHVGDWSRLSLLVDRIAPMRTDGEHVLIAPNRSFGMRGMIMPHDWAERSADHYAKVTKRRVYIRPHPGNSAPAVPLEHDLRGAYAVVIWSSSVGVKALLDGIHVICDSPHWICKSATFSDWGALGNAGSIEFGERRNAALRALAWAQWRVEEIASGTAFQNILSVTR